MGRVSHSQALSDEIRSACDLQGWGKGNSQVAGRRRCAEEREGRILPSSWTACFHSCYAARQPDWEKKKKGRPRPSSKHFLLASLWLSIPHPATSSDVPPNELPSLLAVFREVGGKLSTVHTRAKLLKASVASYQEYPALGYRLLKGNFLCV